MTMFGLNGRALALAIVLASLTACGGTASIATNAAVRNLTVYRDGQSVTTERGIRDKILWQYYPEPLRYIAVVAATECRPV